MQEQPSKGRREGIRGERDHEGRTDEKGKSEVIGGKTGGKDGRGRGWNEWSVKGRGGAVRKLRDCHGKTRGGANRKGSEENNL